MKKIFLISLLSLLIVSCKTSKHAGCDAYSQVTTQHSKEYYEIVKFQESLTIYIKSLS